MLTDFIVGDPTPDIFWIQPNGESRQYSQPPGVGMRMNDAILTISKPYDHHHHSHHAQNNVHHSLLDQGPQMDHKHVNNGVDELAGMYICLALNAAGNATLTLNVSWPKIIPPTNSPASTSLPPLTTRPQPHLSQSIHGIGYPDSRQPQDDDSQKDAVISNRNDVIANNHVMDVSHDDHDVEINKEIHTISPQDEDLSKHFQTLSKQYTMFELVGAILGTFIFTLLVCIVVIPLYLRRQWKKKHRTPSLRNDKTYDKHKHDQMMYLGHLYPEDYLYTRTPLNPQKHDPPLPSLPLKTTFFPFSGVSHIFVLAQILCTVTAK